MNIKLLLFVGLTGSLSLACSQPKSTESQAATVNLNFHPVSVLRQGDTIVPVEKSEAEWKALLTNEEFRVLRKAGTERPFTGDLWNNKEEGTYVCAGCELPLFSSETKFKSGTGWPSFYQPIREGYIIEKEDRSYGMVRTEVLCARCGGHQGHVFEDGPQPTGLRYCINSVSMDFIPIEQ